MMRFFLLLLLTVLFIGCRTIEVPVPVVKTEIEYRDRVERDTAYVHDSVYIHQKGDTVYLEKYKYIYQEHVKTDTSYIYHCDTITRVQIVEKQLSKWQEVKMNAGGYCIVSLLLLVLALIVYVIYRIWKR